jgi:hypothetical protein
VTGDLAHPANFSLGLQIETPGRHLNKVVLKSLNEEDYSAVQKLYLFNQL